MVDISMTRLSLAMLRAEIRKLQGDGRGTVLLAISAGWGLAIGARMIYPVVLPQLREAYELDLAHAGALLTVLFVAYALGQLPGGLLADRIGERVTLTMSMLLSGGALGAVLFARSRTALFVATALFGFAVGFYAIARFTAVASLYPQGFGTAIGITNAAPALGQAVFPALAGSITALLGWQFGLGYPLPIFVLIAVALWLTLRGPSSNRGAAGEFFSRDTVQTLVSAFKEPSVILATVVLTLGFFIWQAFTGFYPTYLMEEKGLSQSVAGLMFGVYFVASAAIHPISGLIYDRWDVTYTVPIAGVAVLMFLSLPFVERISVLVVISILLGTLLAFETSTESYLVDALPSLVEGTGYGILRTFVFATGAVSPVLFGAIADRGFFDELFFVLAGIGVLMIVIATQLPVNE